MDQPINKGMSIWPNRDPYGEAGSFNLMGFVNNNGINNFDAFGLYNSAGHFSTTYLVAIAAGMSPDQAFQYAYWSQYPDQNPDFSAVHTSLTLKWEVGQYLHSLSGGDPVMLRQYLECLLKSGKFSVEEQGMLIHALGDAYAHTSIDTAKFSGSGHGRVPNPNYGQLRSYGPGIGHLFDGHAPDYIGNNPSKYGEYVDQLYEVMQSLNPGGNYDPSMINNLKLQAYLMPPSNLASDLGSTATQNGFEASMIGMLPGGYDGFTGQSYDPDDSSQPTLLPVQSGPEAYSWTESGDFRNSLIDKIKNGVNGWCPPNH